MASVHFVKEDEPIPPMPQIPALKTPYLPDRWQQFAIHAIENEENVLATCPTGSGKSFVAEYQCAKSIQKGKRVFFTTPIKSLSNQKYYDLKKLFPDTRIGIYTGDIKQCPDAQILVMTTEILRNLLFKKGTKTESVGATSILSLEGLDAVVFDEVHYINDKDRGHVWEETLMLLPPEVKLVLLSATLSSPQTFAKWIADNKQRKVWVISTLWRAVPLTHCVRDDSTGKLLTVYNSKEIFHDDIYRSWFVSKRDGLFAYDKFKDKVKDARRAGVDGPIEGKTRPKAFEHQLNDLLDHLHKHDELPAIVFQFSRKGCERLAAKTQGTFIDSSDSTVVKHIWNFHLSRFSEGLEKSPQYHTLYELVQRGIAFHHSGLIPFLKEILEILFNKGYIKLLYATETFAVGINMPTKTVIFTALDKFSDGGPRLLTTAEYIQMAGRAGRRGKDDKGLVIYLPQRDPLEVGEMRGMLTGVAQRFCSRMGFHYDFVLKLLNSGKPMSSLVEGSYWWVLETETLQMLEKELESAQKKSDSLRRLVKEEEVEACEKRKDIDNRIATNTNAKRKAAQKDLVRWQQDHPEGRWKPVLERYDAWKEADENRKRVESLHSALKARGSELPDVQRRRSVLQEFGFLTCEGGDVPIHRLSHKGLLASEVNEGHPFLMTEMFLRIASSEKPWELTDLLITLALFLGEYSTKENPNAKMPADLQVAACVKDEIFNIDEDAAKFEDAERRVSLPDDQEFWALSTEWIEPIQSWLTEESTLGSIAQRYELFEGNMQKALMSLASLVEEMQSLATLNNSVDLLRLLEPARELILRDIVIAESLYLRL